MRKPSRRQLEAIEYLVSRQRRGWSTLAFSLPGGRRTGEALLARGWARLVPLEYASFLELTERGEEIARGYEISIRTLRVVPRRGNGIAIREEES